MYKTPLHAHALSISLDHSNTIIFYRPGLSSKAIFVGLIVLVGSMDFKLRSLHGTLEVLTANFADDILGCGVLRRLLAEARSDKLK